MPGPDTTNAMRHTHGSARLIRFEPVGSLTATTPSSMMVVIPSAVEAPATNAEVAKPPD